MRHVAFLGLCGHLVLWEAKCPLEQLNEAVNACPRRTMQAESCMCGVLVQSVARVLLHSGCSEHVILECCLQPVALAYVPQKKALVRPSWQEYRVDDLGPFETGEWQLIVGGYWGLKGCKEGVTCVSIISGAGNGVSEVGEDRVTYRSTAASPPHVFRDSGLGRMGSVKVEHLCLVRIETDSDT